jgi:hypothetical protein
MANFWRALAKDGPLFQRPWSNTWQELESIHKRVLYMKAKEWWTDKEYNCFPESNSSKIPVLHLVREFNGTAHFKKCQQLFEY